MKQKIIVTVYGRRANFLILPREQNLVVVPIHDEAIGNTFLNVVRSTVIVHDEILPLLQLRLLLGCVLSLWEVLLHVLKHLLHILKSLSTELRKSLSTLHFILKL